MKKWSTLVVFAISLTSLFFSLVAFQNSRTKDEDFRSKLLNLVRQCVNFNEAIPQKEEIIRLLDEIEEKDFVLQEGSDDLRVKYVTAQGCLEHVLACSQALGEVKELIGMIHTPTPATPLCTLPDPLDESLLDESIRFDANKLLTVRSRAQIVREYLIKGGTLYVVYPQGGLEKRTSQQQVIYRQELKNYPHQLIDWVLSTTRMEPDMVGATYFFRDAKQNVYVFSIKSKQANAPEENSEWGIWFGEVQSPVVKRRIETLFSYFRTCDGPNESHFKI